MRDFLCELVERLSAKHQRCAFTTTTLFSACAHKSMLKHHHNFTSERSVATIKRLHTCCLPVISAILQSTLTSNGYTGINYKSTAVSRSVLFTHTRIFLTHTSFLCLSFEVFM